MQCINWNKLTEKGSVEVVEQEEKRKAVEALLADCSEEHLWACIVAFQGEPLRTMSGLPYSIHTKEGKTWRHDKGTLGGPAGEQQVHHLELSPDGVPECAEDEGKPFGR